MKNYTNHFFSVSILLIVISLFLSSCSLTFEKRRYRPGYHVEVVKKRNQQSLLVETGSDVIQKKEMDIVEIPRQKKSLPSVMVPQKVSQNVLASKTKIEQNLKSEQVTMPHNWSHFKARRLSEKQFFNTKQTQAKSKLGLIFGLVFGSISFAFLVAGIVFLATGSFGGLFYGFIFMICCLVTLILALVLGLIKWKEADATKPLKPGYVNGSFIFSIVTLVISLVGFVFGFLVYPFGIVALSIGSVMTAASIVGIGLGFAALKKDKSIKTKLIIIFAFIALILAILAMILAFL